MKIPTLRMLEVEEKPWVEVKVLPGAFSDTSKLGYNHTVLFKDSKTMEI